MANNLRVFNTNSEYQSADLVHPAVSYVIETDKVIYEPTPPTPSFKWKATYSDSSVTSAECGSSSEIVRNEIFIPNLVSAEIGDCVTTIGSQAFLGCDSLTSITIPNSVTSIGDNAFNGCESLTSINIPSGVTSIGYRAFDYCIGLTRLNSDVDGVFNIPDSVTSIGDEAIQNCRKLTTCTIGSGITSIGEFAFFDCKSLTSVTVNAVTPPTLGDYAFDSTNNDLVIYVPCESVEAYKAAWSRYASRITCIQPSFKWKAILSNGTTQSGACTSNTVLNGNSLPTSTVNLEVGDCVTELSNFEGKINNLSSCTISDSVTKIGGSVFYQKHNLKTVVVGSGCTSIGKWAFNQADRLESLTFKSIVPPTLGDYVFVDTNNCPIYVPSASLTAYQTASGWSQYKSRFLPIP